MELAVARVLVSPVVSLLITKVLNYCSGEIATVWGVKGDLEKLSEKLELIDAVLHDAEKLQVENQLVTVWLEKLKDVVYDAEDILDELQYEDLRCKMKNKSNMLRLFPSAPIGFGYKIAHEIKDVGKKLDEITKDMEKFKFISHLGGHRCSNAVMSENIPETSSHINDSAAVVGRKDDLSKILDLLKQESSSVVRISGMGGIGKTTLARLVFNFKELAVDNNHHFKLKIWVSVSRKSDIKEIFCDLLESNKETTTSLEVIKNRLKERLKVKCLIVLDDVWIKNDNFGIDVEQLLKDILSMSGNGSKILITMRSAEPIHPMADCRYKIYPLEGLPKSDCWSIFENMAFGHGGENWECKDPDLISIGKQIASKCGGIPLVAKTLGGLLYSKKDRSEWLSILTSQIWNLPDGENKIMSLLKWSYDHLSPYVKRCFSYCSIFPKGHCFMKKELIKMWLAEGFLISSGHASPETVGNDYFKKLLLNSFFQDECRNKWGDIKSCRMHDLVHDLAILIAGSESHMVMASSKDDDQEVDMQCNKFRHLGLQVLDKDVSAIPSEIYKASKLQIFVSFCPPDYEILGNGAWAKKIFSLSLLRVLNLSRTGVEELPQSISKLKHLRYLDISHTGIKTFPTSFSKLYNLQTLSLEGCRLKELPKDMRKLISLEYLIFSDRPDVKNLTTRKISRSRKLKKLSVFVVGTGKGYGIEELKNLNLLGGKLVITNLERVTDATQANLKGKKDIIHLHLRWDSGSCNTSDRYNKDNVVLKDLQPHPNLKELTILYFGGSEFPEWMMSTSLHLPNLVNITLCDCVNCEHLPALGRLPSLRSLYMERMGAIKRIGGEFYQSNGAASFPSLVKLYLRSFYNLEEWLGDQQQSSASSFPCLESLKILDCNHLLTTPTSFRSLKKLDFEIKLIASSHLTSLPLKLIRGGNNVLQTLVVRDCKEFAGFLPDDDEEQQHRQPDHLFNHFLSKIEILRCPSLTFLPANFSGLISLTYLAIEGCESLKSLPDGIQYLPALQTLIIGGFSEDLLSFPFPAATGSDGEQYFISLRELRIRGWPTLRDDVFPDQLQLLTSLEYLSIKHFPCLLSLPEWFGVLSSLQTFEIENCSRLKYLPSEEQMLRLTSLEILNIRGCPLLLERCSCGKEEWHKVACLKQVVRSSPPVVDNITRDADMNEELLERRRSGIFANNFKEKCWIDSSGRYCFMLFPRSLLVEWGQDRRYWRWLSITEPSASGDGEIEVPNLVKVSWLHVEGKIDMSKLNPGVYYEVVFVVMMFEESCGWGTPVELWLVLPDGHKLVQKLSLESMPKSKWIEIHVGDFETPQQPADEERVVHFIMFEHVDQLWKRGFVIEGAIVRPKK
ncbi:hypothetical protein MKW98_029487 [Papaver atlanticum]|uniref:Uncharacterized protein n=1 Tax=Papaver atlanticum TaxID=357466 RepID=A0AAD4SIZ2_9MAGN|nr:hypothetical protein MKW98_029487 [Papaver atlanticum]